MNTVILLGIVALLLFLRQPLLVILLSATAFVHLVWGKGDHEYIVEDMWIGLDKELILSIPLFILCGNVMTKGTTAKRLVAEAGLGLAPGSAFAPQAQGWLRWCFASKDLSRLGQGVQRLQGWLAGPGRL